MYPFSLHCFTCTCTCTSEIAPSLQLLQCTLVPLPLMRLWKGLGFSNFPPLQVWSHSLPLMWNQLVSEERLAFSWKQYDAMVEERRNASQPIPLNEGVLIFDKVKVGLKVHYHAKSGKLLGLPMSADVLASLHDVYQTLQSEHRTAKTSYVLQFLWRCTTSNFDVISPYFTSAAAMSTKFIVAFSDWNSALYASLWI